MEYVYYKGRKNKCYKRRLEYETADTDATWGDVSKCVGINSRRANK